MADERKPQDDVQDDVKDTQERSDELSDEQLDDVAGGKTSPNLMQACATGEHIKEATITH